MIGVLEPDDNEHEAGGHDGQEDGQREGDALGGLSRKHVGKVVHVSEVEVVVRGDTIQATRSSC